MTNKQYKPGRKIPVTKIIESRIMKLDKNTPVGTVAIHYKAYPFKMVALVSSEDFAEFGLQDTENFQAKELVENRSTDSSLCFAWTYLGVKVPAWD